MIARSGCPGGRESSGASASLSPKRCCEAQIARSGLLTAVGRRSQVVHIGGRHRELFKDVIAFGSSWGAGVRGQRSGEACTWNLAKRGIIRQTFYQLNYLKCILCFPVEDKN